MNSFCVNVLRRIRYSNRIFISTSSTLHDNVKKEQKSEININYLGDPDTFGTLSRKLVVDNKLEEEGDIKEEQYLQNIPLKTQKLTIKQYADLIKQYIKYKRLKEALNILEIRMIKEDRVKPENYIYNILIGACADVGYTKMAFKLFNDMKRRALKPTGDTYTCLFESCINSPWESNGLKNATHLRNLMIEKGIEPNLTNYNVMIKAFGRCGDLQTAFKIVDEMISKNIKIRVHTFNHLLQACISDKESGLRHALLVWRKMLKMREKPNIYSFNLMLRCVKECNLGTEEDLQALINEIQANMLEPANLKLLEMKTPIVKNSKFNIENNETLVNSLGYLEEKETMELNMFSDTSDKNLPSVKNNTDLMVIESDVTLQLINNQERLNSQISSRTVPNLLSKSLKMEQVVCLQLVHTPQDNFAIVGGQEDFLKEMKEYNVKPDIKTFTQMLHLLDKTTESETHLISVMKSSGVKADIDFYNMLIKKRCLRNDYDSALAVRDLIEEERKIRKEHPFKKKKLKFNIMTYGVLALACKRKESAEKLLNEMKEKKLNINIEILGTLLQNATFELKFGYVVYIMNVVKQENIRVNNIFLRHLEVFNEKCMKIIEKNEKEQRDNTLFKSAYQKFNNRYNEWLKDINVDEALKEEHPWQQFKEPQPETVQRDNIKIVQPKKFYKRNRKFIKYMPRI